ncbi:LMBR1 domain-containing protein 2 like A, partial [Trifolium medium]|nr:LMBR1 domain-containing protein 2 like A [Trifolium medium]
YPVFLQGRNSVELKTTSDLITEEVNGGVSKTLDEETRRYGSSREAISNKYAAIRAQGGSLSKLKAEEKNVASYSVLDEGNTNSRNSAGAPSS